MSAPSGFTTLCVVDSGSIRQTLLEAFANIHNQVPEITGTSIQLPSLACTCNPGSLAAGKIVIKLISS